MKQVVTSTDYAHPKRPLPLRLYNHVGSKHALEAHALLDAARASTGLDDFGDPWFRGPLAVLLDSVRNEARLNPLGTTILAGRIVSMLENRLRLEAYVRAHPEIESIAISRPIVIAGLQRTGTTMLHRLIAADPRARALRSWEALHPTPMPFEGERGSVRRRFESKLAEEGLRAIAPEFFAIHPVEADAPEEDVLLLDHAFASQAPEATMHVPSYASHLESLPQVPAYRFLARALQALTYQRRGDFWVLKTPHHMEYLNELTTVFPDAVIVHTHRDPQATMGSFCSMVAHGRGVFSDHVDAREVGRHWLRKTRRMIDTSLRAREGKLRGAFVEVSYYDVMRDPIAEVRRIYAHAGRELTDDAERAMREVLARDVQHRYGRHVYRTRDFGLSPACIEEAFADYRARFDIPRESRAGEDATSGATHSKRLGHDDPLSATVSGLLDLVSTEGYLPGLDDSVRLEGKTALVTGANTGLGKAVAIDLARRGARLLLACRSGIPEAGHDVARASGNPAVEMLQVDLSDLDSVVALTDELARRGERLDLLVCNAGLVPSKGQRAKQGSEVMFAVHYAANHVLTRRLLASGVVPNDVYASNGTTGTRIPRIVFVSSEAHRSSKGIDFDHFGAFVDYGVADGMTHYGNSKLVLTTFATELSRRLTTPKGPSVAVHTLCPGPVASSIARNAPDFVKPLVDPVMRTLFRSPEQACAPVVYLAAAPELAGDTGWYMHLMRKKDPSPLALDPALGARLWDAGESLLRPYLPQG